MFCNVVCVVVSNVVCVVVFCNVVWVVLFNMVCLVLCMVLNVLNKDVDYRVWSICGILNRLYNFILNI